MEDNDYLWTIILTNNIDISGKKGLFEHLYFI